MQPPAEDKINGILLGFRLRYRELLHDSVRGSALRGLGRAPLTRECPGDTGWAGLGVAVGV